MSVYSKVVCVLLNSWDGNKEWSVDLPEGEEALAIAAGKGWVAVATDTRNLRLLTVAGTQREVISLPGPVVCVAGHRNRLLVIFHSGMGKSRYVKKYSSFLLLSISICLLCIYILQTSKNEDKIGKLLTLG
jgi:hypothetical protein